jgi:transcriptional repressor of cell division inhibition gene dicB
MEIERVVDFYGSKAAIARALGITPVAVSRWQRDIPPLRQLQIQSLTGGKIKADPTILPARRRAA